MTATVPEPTLRPHIERPHAQPPYQCACGNVLRVYGVGRHRVYFELAAHRDDPIMDRVCPACHRALPGKGLGFSSDSPRTAA